MRWPHYKSEERRSLPADGRERNAFWWFVVWVITGLCIILYGLNSLERSCRLEEKELTNYHGQAEIKQTQTRKGRGTSTNEFAASFELRQAPPQEGQKQPPEAKEGTPPALAWWDHFRCDLKVGDAALVFFTYCLVVVGAFQAFFLRKSIIDTGIAARAAQAGVKLAQEEFRLSHPAHIVVGRFMLSGQNDTLEQITFVIRNVGHTTARVFRIGAGLLKPESDGLPPSRPDGLVPEGVSYDLAPGQGQIHTWKLNQEWLEQANFLYGFERGGRESGGLRPDDYSSLLFMGYVDYLTATGLMIEADTRQTGFLRRFNIGTKRFIIVDDPDYEYQD
ncbi:MAG: hypothetical protein H7322_10690 [Ramlibacter sp.]|nr:hypothetical protein [Ramlibacter sp.]